MRDVSCFQIIFKLHLIYWRTVIKDCRLLEIWSGFLILFNYHCFFVCLFSFLVVTKHHLKAIKICPRINKVLPNSTFSDTMSNNHSSAKFSWQEIVKYWKMSTINRRASSKGREGSAVTDNWILDTILYLKLCDQL